MKSTTEISRLIALVLRHKPEALGIELDEYGWADASLLIERINAMQPFDQAMLEKIVRTDSKQRYAFSPDGTHIRASQGHSIPVNLGLKPVTPPETLWHGTGKKYVDSILRQGLLPRSRQYVHLSADPDTALKVGMRHGSPVLFTVDTAGMLSAGRCFYRSENGVWLTDAVPPEFLKRVER